MKVKLTLPKSLQQELTIFKTGEINHGRIKRRILRLQPLLHFDLRQPISETLRGREKRVLPAIIHGLFLHGTINFTALFTALNCIRGPLRNIGNSRERLVEIGIARRDFAMVLFGNALQPQLFGVVYLLTPL